jgi:hypothetical protein
MDDTYYFEQYVWPNYQAFQAEPGSRHLAMNSAVAAYHMLEWLAFRRSASSSPATDDTLNELRRAVRDACSDFELVEDVVTAYKHIWSRPMGAGRRLRIFTELVKVRTAWRDTRWIDRQGWDDDKAWQDHYETVVVSDGTAERELLSALNQVVAYWGDCIYGSDSAWTMRRPDPDGGTGILR